LLTLLTDCCKVRGTERTMPRGHRLNGQTRLAVKVEPQCAVVALCPVQQVRGWLVARRRRRSTHLGFDGVAQASEDDVAVVVSVCLRQNGRVHTANHCVGIMKW